MIFRRRSHLCPAIYAWLDAARPTCCTAEAAPLYISGPVIEPLTSWRAV